MVMAWYWLPLPLWEAVAVAFCSHCPICCSLRCFTSVYVNSHTELRSASEGVNGHFEAVQTHIQDRSAVPGEV